MDWARASTRMTSASYLSAFSQLNTSQKPPSLSVGLAGETTFTPSLT
ncbi:hypothetical protein [Nonomuraea sp. LPB2021202275-12-8]